MPRPVMAAIISRVKRYLLLITFYLALWADINQNCDYKKNDTSHSELEHRSFPNSQFNISGYNLFRRDRKKGGGGIIVYVRDNIAATRRKKTGKLVESISLDVNINNRRFAVVCVYKPPTVDNAVGQMFTRYL